jgi:hypothetical protein
MSNVQIGLLVLLGISAFGFVTLSIDLWRARRPGKGQMTGPAGPANRRGTGHCSLSGSQISSTPWPVSGLKSAL